MKVRIVKCSERDTDDVGKIIEVVNYIYNDNYYQSADTRLLLKSDCEIVKEEVEKSCENCKFSEGTCIATELCGDGARSSWQPKKQEDKHTHPEIHKQLLVNDLCRQCDKREECQIDVTYDAKCSEFTKSTIIHSEKPKKLKYVCRNCDVRKCKCTFNEDTRFPTNEYCLIANCYADWKLKGEK